MSEVFFIGDTHFGHRGIITFSGTKPFRPFATIEEHDAELVRRWNSVVGKKDTVWHLGDFCFGKRNGSVANYRKQESLDSQVLDFPIHDFRILPRNGNFATEPR